MIRSPWPCRLLAHSRTGIRGLKPVTCSSPPSLRQRTRSPSIATTSHVTRGLSKENLSPSRYTGSAATVLSPTARVAVPPPARTRLPATARPPVPHQPTDFPQPFETAPRRRFHFPFVRPSMGPEQELSV